jgi:hypothetical protein
MNLLHLCNDFVLDNNDIIKTTFYQAHHKVSNFQEKCNFLAKNHQQIQYS